MSVIDSVRSEIAHKTDDLKRTKNSTLIKLD